MKNCNNQKFNVYIPGRSYPQEQKSNDQTSLIIGLGFMCIMSLVVIFGLLILVINK